MCSWFDQLCSELFLAGAGTLRAATASSLESQMARYSLTILYLYMV